MTAEIPEVLEDPQPFQTGILYTPLFRSEDKFFLREFFVFREEDQCATPE